MSERSRRRRRGGFRLTGAGAAKAAAGAALCLLGGLWVVKTAAVDALARGRPAAVAMAAAVAPDHPQAKLALASMQLDIGTGEVPEDARLGAFTAFERAPLAEEPVLIAGLRALQAGRGAEGETLLLEARRRNPRNRYARLFLIDRYLRTGRVEQAGLELASLRGIVPGVAEALAPQLATMVRDERSGASLIRVLSRDQGLQQAVLSSLATNGSDPDLILRIAQSGPAAAPTPEGLPWQRQLLALLIERGDYARALRLWRTFAGLPAGGNEKSIHDGRFQGLPGAVPFNWSFFEGSAGVAERVPGRGLDVQFFGRESAELAMQVLVLRPGRYRLSFRAEGSAKGDDGRLAWRIFCRGNDAAPIMDLTLRDINAAPRVLSGEFTVSPACPAQTLRLSGIAGEFPGTQSVSIAELQVAPAGGR